MPQCICIFLQVKVYNLQVCIKKKKRTKKAAEGKNVFCSSFRFVYTYTTCPTVPFSWKFSTMDGRALHPFLKCRQTQGLEVVANSLFGNVCLIHHILRRACVRTAPETGFGCV
ncbi:unnamed protein product [Pipistrellus nathusii]|uniref:Secreted protein n=1 Tax=Pipistrellus nathusii TaxID=59473 RepID=A0ABN9ZXL2_PIPNA